MAAVSTRPSRAGASPFSSSRDTRRDDGPSSTTTTTTTTKVRSTANEQPTSDKARKADAEDSSTEGADDSLHLRASSDPSSHDNNKSSSGVTRPPARPGRNGGRSPLNRSSKDDEPNPFEQSFSKPPSSTSTAAAVPSNRFDTPRRARSTSPTSNPLSHSTSAIRTPAGGTKLPSLASLEAASPAGDLAGFWDAGGDSLRVGPLSPAMLPGPISTGGVGGGGGAGDATSRWLFNPMQSGLTPLINGMAGTAGGVGGMPAPGGGGMTPGTAALFQMMTNATPGTSGVKTGTGQAGTTKAAEGNAFEDSFARATTAAESVVGVKSEVPTTTAPTTTAANSNSNSTMAPMFMAIQQAPKPLTSMQRTSISGPGSNVSGVGNGFSSRGSSLSTQGGLGPRHSITGPIPVPFGAQPYSHYGGSTNTVGAAGASQSSASPVSRHANSVSPPYGHAHAHNPLYLLTQAQHQLQHSSDHNDESVMAAAALSKLVGGGGGGGGGQQSVGYPAQQEFGHQQQMVLQQQQQAAQQYHAAAAAAAAQQEHGQGRGAKRGSVASSQTSKDGGNGGGAGTKRKKSAAGQGAPAAGGASAKKKAKKGKDDDVASASSAPTGKGKAAQQQQMTRMDDEDDDEDGMDDDDEEDVNGGGKKKSNKPETDEEKRKNFLERNRQAALKCRQRKKAWLQNLQARVEYLTTDNDALQNQVASLREEISSLRAVLVAHKDCAVNAHGASGGQTVGGVLAGQTFAPTHAGGKAQMHAPMGAMGGHHHAEDGARGAAPSGALRY